MNKNPFLAVSQIVHQSFLDYFKTLDAAEPLPPIALKACPLAEELNLDENEALLLTLLIKAKIQIKAASALGLTLLALQTLVFVAAAGALGLVALGGVAYTRNRPQPQAA